MSAMTSSSMTPTHPTPRVCAVIVTYNRLALLKEAFAALLHQTRKVDSILIVDNGSTDGTADWLSSVASASVQVVTQANLGCTGGFHTGLQAALATGADWLWCMDDDTVPDPDCLAGLLAAEAQYREEPNAAPLGWICSIVRWKDGTAHRMNEPKVKGFLDWGTNILRTKILPAQWCSFVSVAFSRQAVMECGLPLKNMFIWGDDVEYTGRMTVAGFAGLAALESGAEHKTATNYAPDIEDLSPENLWRFRYAFRNDVVVLKTVHSRNRGKLYFQFAKMMLRRVFLLAQARKLRYLPMAMAEGFRGFFFPMDVDYPTSSASATPVPSAAPLSASGTDSSPPLASTAL
jgi:GT2 family glycosyltransferase